MKKLFSIVLTLIMLAFFTGCVHVEEFVRKVKGAPAKSEISEISEEKIVFDSRAYWQKALAYEKQDELLLALIHMNIAGELSPNESEISEKISYLKSTIKQQADQHFNEGVELYKKRRFKSAREQFITVLRYDPGHREALGYLKNRLSEKAYEEYRVRKNDTLRSISEKFYNDPEKDFLIAHLNSLDLKAPLAKGTILNILTLDPELAKPPISIAKELTKAKTLLDEKAYNDVLGIAEKILEYDRLNQEAKDLKNAVYYQLGLELSRQNKYVEAIDMLKRAEPQYEGIGEAIQEVTDRELKRAEGFFKEKRYKQVLDVTRNILTRDPSNKNAGDLINAVYCQMGRDFIAQKDYVQALATLNKANPEHDCVKKALSEVKQMAKQQAEAHYLRGVKHFLNEELTAAITEWEQALSLDPDDKKIKDNIKKARDLLKKLEAVE